MESSAQLTGQPEHSNGKVGPVMLLYNKEKHASQKDFQEYPQLNSFEKDE
jgi:hypothetical protein